MISPKNILEIGTYTGFSALCLAEGLKDEGRLDTIEVNDELCASIPGPGFTECVTNNTAPEPAGTDVGFVHIHNGIHGTGDLTEASRDWRGPVARVEITRVR